MSESKSFGAIVTGGTVTAHIPLTTEIFITTGGVVDVGGPNTGLINMGTIATGTHLPIAINQVGTLTTASILPIR
jgi:hypothetical protein